MLLVIFGITVGWCRYLYVYVAVVSVADEEHGPKRFDRFFFSSLSSHDVCIFHLLSIASFPTSSSLFFTFPTLSSRTAHFIRRGSVDRWT
jgi:hypothetical protein